MPEKETRRPSAVRGLSARLFVLTVLFLLLAEVLIWTPSIARFRKVYLEQRVSDAHLASLALEATPDNMVSKELEMELLAHAGAHGIVLRKPGRKILMLSKKMPPSVDLTIDLGRGGFMIWIRDAFQALAQNENRIMRLIGVAPTDAGVGVEVILDETPMRQAMYAYSGRILQLSIVISLITAGLLYVSLQWLLVRPMRRITHSMTEFRENPEDETRTIRPSGRDDEIGVAERELAVMQKDVRAALRQKTRLATLGAAVAKINHDLRNSLATAMLVSDKLADIDDPEVKKVAPRLYEAMDRAVDLCSQTLKYVSDDVPPMKPSHFHVHELVAEVGSALSSREAPDEEGTALEWRNEVAFELDVEADRGQLFRVLNNLGRNARHAGAGNVHVSARLEGGRILIDVADDGPGLSDKARDRLFQPFSGSARDGGTGLGLVIARDIMRAHGGDIELVKTGPGGTTFRMLLPARPRRPADG